MTNEQQMGELFPAEVAATEAVSFEKASLNHAKSDLIKDRDITRVLWRVFRDAGALDAESIWKVAELEISYSRCDFEAALEGVDGGHFSERVRTLDNRMLYKPSFRKDK